MGKRDKVAGMFKGSQGGNATTRLLLDEMDAITNVAEQDAHDSMDEEYKYEELLHEEEERLARQAREEEEWVRDNTHTCRVCRIVYVGGVYDDWCDMCEYIDFVACGEDGDTAKNLEEATMKWCNVELIRRQLAAAQAELDDLPHNKCVGCRRPVRQRGSMCTGCARM